MQNCADRRWMHLAVRSWRELAPGRALWLPSSSEPSADGTPFCFSELCLIAHQGLHFGKGSGEGCVGCFAVSDMFFGGFVSYLEKLSWNKKRKIPLSFFHIFHINILLDKQLSCILVIWKMYTSFCGYLSLKLNSFVGHGSLKECSKEMGEIPDFLIFLYNLVWANPLFCAC